MFVNRIIHLLFFASFRVFSGQILNRHSEHKSIKLIRKIIRKNKLILFEYFSEHFVNSVVQASV